jgi:hypothetical protein
VDVFNLVMTWIVAFTSGVVAALGIAQAASGRVFGLFNRDRIDWTPGEARLQGAGWAVVGVSWALYGLYVGLEMAGAIPMFGVGHWWWMFASAPVWLINFGFLLGMALMESRHKGRWPFRRGSA